MPLLASNLFCFPWWCHSTGYYILSQRNPCIEGSATGGHYRWYFIHFWLNFSHYQNRKRTLIGQLYFRPFCVFLFMPRDCRVTLGTYQGAKSFSCTNMFDSKLYKACLVLFFTLCHYYHICVHQCKAYAIYKWQFPHLDQE